MAKEGIGTVQMTLGETKYSDESWSIPQDVFIKCSFPGLEGNYTVAWDNYLTDLGMDPVGSNEYRMSGVETLVIKEYEVQIKNI